MNSIILDLIELIRWIFLRRFCDVDEVGMKLRIPRGAAWNGQEKRAIIDDGVYPLTPRGFSALFTRQRCAALLAARKMVPFIKFLNFHLTVDPKVERKLDQFLSNQIAINLIHNLDGRICINGVNRRKVKGQGQTNSKAYGWNNYVNHFKWIELTLIELDWKWL